MACKLSQSVAIPEPRSFENRVIHVQRIEHYKVLHTRILSCGSVSDTGKYYSIESSPALYFTTISVTSLSLSPPPLGDMAGSFA